MFRRFGAWDTKPQHIIEAVFWAGDRYGLALLLAPVGFEVKGTSHRRRRRWCCLHESHSARSVRNDRR